MSDRRNHAVNILKALQTCIYCDNTLRFEQPLLDSFLERLEHNEDMIDTVLAGKYISTCGCKPCPNYSDDLRKEP